MSSSFVEKYVFTLDDDAKKYAEEFLNETDVTRAAALEDLKQWMQDNPHLNVEPSERHLLAFLRGCKFNLDKTKKKLTAFYEMKRDRTEWFENRSPHLPEIQELAKIGVFVPLKQLNADKQLVVIIRAAAHNPKRHQFNDVMKTGLMMLDLACKDNEYAQIYGVTAIFDMNGISLAHGRQFTPGLIKNVVYSWMNYHCRPKRLEYINAPLYINCMLRLFKAYMSAKLKGRVRVHFVGLEGLYEAVGKDILPEEYGGTDGKFSDLKNYWYKKMVEAADWYAENEKYKAETFKCDQIK